MPLSSYSVADVMHTDVETRAPEEPLRPVLEAIVASRYGCYVVVDEQSRPLGIVTGGDLIRHMLADEAPGGAYLKAVLSSPEALARYVRESEHAHGDRVADVMTAPALTVDPDDSLQDVAHLFRTHRVRRFPVARDGVLIGIIRRLDLVGPILAILGEAEQPGRDGEPARE